MTSLRRMLGVVCGLSVLCCLIACGTFKQAIEDATNIQQLGAAYTAYAAKNNQKGPPDAAAWAKWAQENGQGEVVPLINECKGGGKYVFYWNVDLNNLPAGRSATVIGYEAKVTAGPQGMVIMADGTTMQAMSPDQFKAAKKADGK